MSVRNLHAHNCYTHLLALECALDSAKIGMPLDALCVYLQDALRTLGEITGEDATEDVIDRVFERFCVGK